MQAPSLGPGDWIANRYHVRALLGAGAMGQVWRVADSARGGHEIALKTLLGRGKDAGGAKSGLALKHEFRRMTQVRHGNCCEVYDYGQTADGTPYFTMELVPGHDLEQLGQLPPTEVKLVLRQVLLALGYLHRLGFVHRDLKLANVRLQPDGVVKLMDFGLIALVGETTEISGTPAYLAPEVLRRQPMDGRADLYALGVLAFALLTGELPFERASARELVMAHLQDAPRRPSRMAPGVPPELDRVVLRLLEKDPHQRYASAAAVLADIGEAVPPGLGGTLLTSTLVGRDDELQALLDGLAGLAAGKPGRGIVLQAGHGLGKSRLAGELRVAAQLAHVPCATGSYRAGFSGAYAGLAGVLRDLLPALREHVPATLEAHAGVLARLLPELGVEGAVELGSAALNRRRLHGVVEDLLVELASVQPFVAILEDVQWASPASFELLASLLGLASQAPMVWVVTLREQPPGLALPPDARHLPLTPLAPPALERLIGEMLSIDAVDPRLVDEVGRTSGGVPAFAVRTLDYLVRAGQLVAEDGGWRFVATADLAETPARLLLGSLEHLSVDARRLCRLLVVLGGVADADWLALVSGLPDEAFLAALDELQRVAIFKACGNGAYGFALDELRALVEAGLEADQRRALHDAVAVALAVAHHGVPLADLPLAALAELAHHSLAGERPEQAIPLGLAAGLRYARSFAAEEAIAFLRATLGAIEAHPSPAWHQVRLEVLRHLGQQLSYAGQPAEARPLLSEARILAEDLGATGLLPGLLFGLAKIELALMHREAARRCCDEALAASHAERDYRTAIDSLLVRSEAHLALGDYRAALDDATAAVDAALALGEAGPLSQAYAALGDLVLVGEPGHHAAAVEHIEHARGLLKGLGDPLADARIQASLGQAHLLAGAYDEATSAFTRQLAMSLDVGDHQGYVAALVELSNIAIEQGATAEALKMLADARREARHSQKEALMLASEAAEVRCLARAGKYAEARAGLHRLAEHRPADVGVLLGMRLLAVRAEAWLAMGHAEEALAAAAELAAACQASGVWWPRVALAAWSADLCARLGRAEPLLPGADVILAEASGSGRLPDRLLAIEARARQAQATGAWGDMKAEASGGLALARRCGAVVREAHLLELSGLADLALGRPEAAATFTALAETAARLGDRSLQAMASFGLAASQPEAEAAAGLATAAREQLEQLVASLDRVDHAWFWAAPGRSVVREGDFRAFGQPRVRPHWIGRVGLADRQGAWG